MLAPRMPDGLPDATDGMTTIGALPENLNFSLSNMNNSCMLTMARY